MLRVNVIQLESFTIVILSDVSTCRCSILHFLVVTSEVLRIIRINFVKLGLKKIRQSEGGETGIFPIQFCK